MVIERHSETPDLLCGGFVSWQTLETIEALGIKREALGGHAIDRVGLYAGDQCRVAKLPKTGMGLSRRRLDGLLRTVAIDSGARIETGTGLSAANAKGEARLADGSEIAAEALFLATGKYELRGLKRPVGGVPDDPWMGIRYRLPASVRLQDTLHGAIEMHIVRHGYAGLLLQEDGSANLCMAIRRSRLREADGNTRALLTILSRETPSLADRLDGETLPDSVDAVSRVPYGWRLKEGQNGLFRLGDQAAVIPSLAGEGIGIALASGVQAAEAYLSGGPSAAPDFQRRFARSTRRPVAVASALKRIADRPRLARRALSLAALPGLVGFLGEATRIRA